MHRFQLTSTLPRHKSSHQQLFTFMGQALKVESNHPTILEAAAEAFGNFQPESEGSHPPLKISLFVDPAVKEEPERNRYDHPRLVAHTQDHLLFLSVGGQNVAVADLEQGRAFGVLAPAMLQDPEFIRYTFLEALSQAMLGLSRSFAAVHAACVAKDGISILLPAPAGTGKSTLAYACARRGYQVLSEDVIQVDLKSTPLRFWGMPWKFHLLEDARRFFPEIRKEQAVRQVNGERKLVIDLERYHPGSTLASARPGVVVFLQRDGHSAEGRLAPLPADQALARLEVIWSWSTGWQTWMTDRIPELIPLGAYELKAGADPHGSVDLLDRVVKSVGQLAP